jgi:hypothetical protein
VGKDLVLETLENFSTLRWLSAREDCNEQHDNSSEHIIGFKTRTVLKHKIHVENV